MTNNYAEDRRILRDFASQIHDLAVSPEMQRRRAQWTAMNKLEPGRPPVIVHTDGATPEVMAQLPLRCADPGMRSIEQGMRYTLWLQTQVQTDMVLEPRWAVDKAVSDTGWGLERRVQPSTEQRGAWAFDPVIKVPADLRKIHFPEVSHDEQETQRRVTMLQELIGDISPVYARGVSPSVHLMALYTGWRGFEEVLLDMYQEPEMLHEAMALLTEGYQRLYAQYEAMGLLALNNQGYIFTTDELPAAGFDPEHVRLCDLWGWAEDQELTTVSPDMHWEFALQYDAKILAPFGINSYGCCEDLTNKLDYVWQIPKMRQYGVTAWADVRRCAEQSGNQYVLSWRPNPAYLAGESFDETFIRNFFREHFAIFQQYGSIFHVFLKDTETCRHEPDRFIRWSTICQEEITRVWGRD